MQLFFRTLVMVMAALLTAYGIGCGYYEDEAEKGPVATFVGADPPSGTLAANATITVTFDNTPNDITVRAGDARIGKIVVTGKTVTINGPFTPGTLNLTIAWTDGTQTLNYIVTAPPPDAITNTGEAVDDTDVETELPNTEPLPDSPFKVTDATFDKRVLASELPVVVDFWAIWCPPCRIMEPIVKEVASENKETFLVAKLDTDANWQTARKYRIQAIPTFIVFQDGKVVGRFLGAMPKARFVQQILDAIEAQ